MIKWDENWAETVTLFFAVLGFILSVTLQSVLFSYISIILAGFIAGRSFYIRRFREPILPFVFIILGFLVGYLAGSFWVSRAWLLVAFTLSFGLSYYLHLKKIFIIFKSERFIK